MRFRFQTRFLESSIGLILPATLGSTQRLFDLRTIRNVGALGVAVKHYATTRKKTRFRFQTRFLESSLGLILPATLGLTQRLFNLRTIRNVGTLGVDIKHYATARKKTRFRFPMRFLESSLGLILLATLESTQRLTEMSTRGLPEGKGR
jgi:hypothetical protein